MFVFRGPISASKSWLNRALVVQHFNADLQLEINSDSEDVISLKNALQSVGHTNEFDLGMGGTSFRFFAFLISRSVGDWKLKAHQRLIERPQQEIINILNQLNVKAELNGKELNIFSRGWSVNKKIVCSADQSSQFVSGLLLSCWNLNSELEVEIKKPIISYGYLKLTIELLFAAGMNIKINDQENFLTIKIPKNQKSQVRLLEAELDISSAFALISAAIVDGSVEITNWNSKSEQPDLAFLNILEKMNISFNIKDHSFSIAKHNNWKSLDYNLIDSPDLFPVLAVLCAFADGVSTLYGATQLRHKESDRIKKTKELLDMISVKTEVLVDGLRIYGQSANQDMKTPLTFDPDHDHRMAMAAALLELRGYNIQIKHPEVVNKSYPSFWKDIGLQI